MSPVYDVVVVGAGPYGLSTAAHLLGRGLRVAVFGRTLEMWRDRMPKGMLLRSHWWVASVGAGMIRPGTLDGESGSQEQGRSQIFETARASKGRGRRACESTLEVCEGKPEEGEAQEGLGWVAV